MTDVDLGIILIKGIGMTIATRTESAEAVEVDRSAGGRDDV